MVGIYKITSPTNKVYIGQSLNIDRRFKQYERYSTKEQPRLHRSLKKYGFKSHSFEVLEICKESMLNKKERYYQEKYNVLGLNGLNCVLVKTNEKRRKVSKETLLKMSESQKGKKTIHTKETKEKLSNIAIKNGLSKSVLSLTDGIFYESITQAAIAYGYKPDTLQSYLSGRRKNKTNIVLI